MPLPAVATDCHPSCRRFTDRSGVVYELALVPAARLPDGLLYYFRRKSLAWRGRRADHCGPHLAQLQPRPATQPPDGGARATLRDRGAANSRARFFGLGAEAGAVRRAGGRLVRRIIRLGVVGDVPAIPL